MKRLSFMFGLAATAAVLLLACAGLLGLVIQ
jgi:hypothetical protein